MSTKQFLRAAWQGLVDVSHQDPLDDVYRAVMRFVQQQRRTRRVRALARLHPNLRVDVRTGPDA